MTNEKSNRVLKGWMAALSARFALGFLFFFAFFMGCWIAGTGFHDPDTCWLLAVGKHILDTGFIPNSDPFSYTFGALGRDGSVDFDILLRKVAALKPLENGLPSGRVFVPYQWLTEVLFYVAYKVGAGYSVLLAADTILVMGLLVGPLMMFRSLRSPMLVGLGLVILGVVAASFHFLVRPEIFSYLFFLISLSLFVRIRLKLENNRPFNKRDLILLAPMVGLMILWANLHTGFMSIFIALTCYCVIVSVEVLCRPKARKSILALPWLLFGALICASFATPFGGRLWQYIPELFFSPLNKYIRELASINVSHLTEWTFYPFFLFAVIVLAVVGKAVRVWNANRNFPIGWTYSVLMPIGVIIAAICCMRLIPFVVVILVAEVAWLLKGHTRLKRADETADQLEVNEGSLPTLVNARVSTMLGDSAWPAMLWIFSLIGTFMISTRVVGPRIPQGSDVFPSPYEAISYLAANEPGARVFNAAQFGDMMIWYLNSQEKPILTSDPFSCPEVKTNLKVFIDTRFDMYGAPLVSDYYVMRNAQAGWRELFDKYQFDWIFMPPNTPIVKELSQDPNWKAVYQKKDAVILVKQK